MAFLNARKAQMAALTEDGYAKRYRQQAVMFREQSDSARDPSARSIFLRLAAMYQGMADQFAAAGDTRQGGNLSGTAGS